MNGKARLAAVVLGTVVALLLGGCGGGDSAPFWDWDDMRVDMLIENKHHHPVNIYVVDGSSDGGRRDFVARLVPIDRRYFEIDYDFDDGSLEAVCVQDGRIIDTTSVADGKHWHVE